MFFTAQNLHQKSCLSPRGSAGVATLRLHDLGSLRPFTGASPSGCKRVRKKSRNGFPELDQPLSEYGFAYGLKTETRQFSTNFSCEPHGEGKETCLCPSTDRVWFRLFPSTVWAVSKYGLDWFWVRFRYPRRWERVREPHAKQYSDSPLLERQRGGGRKILNPKDPCRTKNTMA